MSKDLLKPRAGKVRGQTDNSKRNGQILQAPRLPEIGGATSMHKKGGPFRNSLSIKKTK